MPKILIIEDESAIRRVLSKIISEENDSYQVSEAEDGLIGIELIKNEDMYRQHQVNSTVFDSTGWALGVTIDS